LPAWTRRSAGHGCSRRPSSRSAGARDRHVHVHPCRPGAAVRAPLSTVQVTQRRAGNPVPGTSIADYERLAATPVRRVAGTYLPGMRVGGCRCVIGSLAVGRAGGGLRSGW
jgi:hypothetical protein